MKSMRDVVYPGGICNGWITGWQWHTLRCRLGGSTLDQPCRPNATPVPSGTMTISEPGGG